MRRGPLPARRGITLVEVLLTASVMSSIMAMAGVLFGRLHERERAGRAELSAALSIARCCEQFRADVRRAMTCEPAAGEDPAGAARWAFVLPDQTIVRYEAEPRRLLRTELRGETIVRREGFVLPEGGRCRLTLDAAAPRIVALRFERDTAEGSVAPIGTIVVEAALGRDLRFRRDVQGGTP